jgi:hypothetical protein
VVGLVATIRKVLFVLSGPSSVSTATLALLLAMVVVFVAAFFLVSRLDPGDSLPSKHAGQGQVFWYAGPCRVVV